MKPIYIIGAGTIGKALAVCLQESGREVTLLRGSVRELAPYTAQIKIVRSDGQQQEAAIQVSSIAHFPQLDGIIVLTSKSFGNQQLASALRERVNNSPVVILQNGLGVEQSFIDDGFPEVYRCVLFVTSQYIDTDTLRFKPVSISPVGIIRGSEGGLQQVVSHLHTGKFQFKAESQIQQVIWKKAIINCVFNSICPLLEVDNGIFHRNEVALSIGKDVIRECLTVAAASGINLPEQEIIDNLLMISRSSDGQFISTLQDIRNGRPTEIDTLNLEIARIAAERNINVQQTKLLGTLTKLKSLI